MRNKLLVSVLLFTSFSLHSSNVKFHSINSLYGISMREVASVCKDKNGFIWASSKTGVLRCTGDDYRIYQLPYENSDIVSVKLLYTNSGLIAYTNNGQLFRYNEITDQFSLLISMSKILQNKYLVLSSMLIDNSGIFWLATSDGLFRYQKRHLTLVENSEEVNFIAWYDPCHLFLSRADGIWLFDKQTLKKKCLYNSNHKFDLHVSKIYYDQKTKRLWIGTISNGLFYYDLNIHHRALVHINNIPKQPILAIEVNSDSTILIGIDGQGLWELNNQGTSILNVYKEDVNNPSSLRGNGVYDIFNDKDKRIWVCTYSGGISFFDKTFPVVDQLTHTINNPNSLSNNNVNKILQDKRGNLWFATDNGISCREHETGKWKTFYQNQLNQTPVFVSLCEDDHGQIWAGSYSSGIYVLDERTGRELAHYSKETAGLSLETNFVLDIFKDSQGDLWFGSARGNLTCYLSKEKKFRNYSRQSIFTFSELSPNKILLACTYGLRLLDKKSGKVKVVLDGYLVQDVISTKDEIWICTSGGGLIGYNRKSQKIQKITTASGLPSNYVNSIIYADGYLWLGTESGLCRYNPEKKDVLTYNSVYPLSHVSFNRNSKCKLSDGQLIWGTSNGAVHFSPKLLTEIQSKGAIFFQDLTLAGRSIRSSLSTPLDSLQRISLNYSQNTLHLELLSIGNVTGAKFSWILKGFDNSWSQPSENRFVHYSNIPSGNYILKIRLYDSSLSHVITERSLAMSIVPPFWRSWWFELLLLAFIVSIIYLSLKYYIERLKQQHAEDKVRIFTNTVHDIRTSVTLIKAPIEELTKEHALSDTGKYYLSLATEQAKRLSAAVSQLMDFQKADIKKEQFTLVMVDIVELIEHRRLMFDSFAKKQNVNLHFISDQDYYQTAVDVSMMEKVIDNLISNAIKYSHPEGDVQIILTCKPNRWSLEVKDNGIGISKKAKSQLFGEFYRGENAINSKIVGSGIGLLLVKNYVVMHGGDISCISHENVGSTFKVVIPFKEVLEKKELENVEIDETITHDMQAVDIESLQQQNELPKQMMRILIVEDNDDFRNFMRYPLQADFDVLLAEDGAEAWDIIQKQMPDLVVSDVMMPKMDGFELCKLMKSTYETSHIPLILLTALSGKIEQLHGLGLGADDYLTKPFDMTLLVQRIKSIIRNRTAVKDKALKLINGVENNGERILANEHNDNFVKKMMEVVRNNMENTEFGKDNFASAMNVSASLLYKKAKSLTNLSPTDFIKMVRLNYALELLHSHKYSITEVSEHCGFSSLGYFCTVFKKHFGKSPTDI
jgi:signal transduction histidine kinase/DNA-binding response OmpR family regulator/ligand-binding sensor domain-containing protein